MSNKDKPTFEQSLAQLNDIVASMETGQLSLEESLKAFEKGIKLTQSCQQTLAKAEQKVKILMDTKSDTPLEDYEND